MGLCPRVGEEYLEDEVPEPALPLLGGATVDLEVVLVLVFDTVLGLSKFEVTLSGADHRLWRMGRCDVCDVSRVSRVSCDLSS